MRPLDPTVINQQIANLLLQYPELGEDEILRADMVEGQTDAFEFLSRCARWIGEEEAMAEGTAEYINNLKARKERIERRAEAFRALAFRIMQAADLKKAELPEATLSVRNGTPKVLITDEAALPDHCVRIKREPDRTAIKDLLTSAVDVPGAVLSNAEPSLSVRVK